MTLVFALGCVSAVTQDYQTRILDEFVIRGNAGVLKCVLPSHVTDLVTVQAWQDSTGATYYPSSDYGRWSTRLR